MITAISAALSMLSILAGLYLLVSGFLGSPINSASNFLASIALFLFAVAIGVWVGVDRLQDIAENGKKPQYIPMPPPFQTPPHPQYPYQQFQPPPEAMR